MIESLSGNCSCSSVSGLPIALPPRGSRTIPLTLDLTRADVGEGLDPVDYQLLLTASVKGDDATLTIGWLLKATVKPTLRIESSAVSLGLKSARNKSVERTFRIHAASGIASLEVDDVPNWNHELNLEGDSHSGTFNLRLVSSGQLHPRVVNDVVRVYPVVPSGERLEPKEIRVTGEIVRDVIATPRMIHCGPQLVGTVVEEAIRLDSLTGCGFRVSQVSTSNSKLSVKSILNEKKSYLLKMNCDDTGDQGTVAQFEIEQDGEHYIVKVPVIYQGTPKSRE